MHAPFDLSWIGVGVILEACGCWSGHHAGKPSACTALPARQGRPVLSSACVEPETSAECVGASTVSGRQAEEMSALSVLARAAGMCTTGWVAGTAETSLSQLWSWKSRAKAFPELPSCCPFTWLPLSGQSPLGSLCVSSFPPVIGTPGSDGSGPP